MKKFLLALLAVSALPLNAHAAYYWERTRNTHTGDGSVLMVDPSAPSAVVAHNYNTLMEYHGLQRHKTVSMTTEECLGANGEVLAVSHAMPTTAPLQTSTPVYMGAQKIIAYPSIPVETVPLQAQMITYTTGGIATDSSNSMMPPTYQPTVINVQPVSFVPPVVETESISGTTTYSSDVSPGYGYADSTNTMVPLQ